MSSTITSSEETTSSNLRNFGLGLLAAILLILLATGILLPRYADLRPWIDAVLTVALALTLVGIGLCIPKRTRAVGGGVVVGVGLGLVLAWCALIVYLGVYLDLMA